MTVKELKQILEYYPEDAELYLGSFLYEGPGMMDIHYGGECSSCITPSDWLDPTEFIRGLEGANQ